MVKQIEELKKTLGEELRKAERELAVELPREIKKAMELGDLTENAEYKAALERQAFVKARIVQLRKRLQELSMFDISRLPRDRAAFGSKVNVCDMDSGEEKQFTLVMPENADLKKGLISLGSPLGRGFIGKSAGDEVHIQTPGGMRNFEILELCTLHDQTD